MGILESKSIFFVDFLTTPASRLHSLDVQMNSWTVDTLECLRNCLHCRLQSQIRKMHFCKRYIHFLVCIKQFCP